MFRSGSEVWSGELLFCSVGNGRKRSLYRRAYTHDPNTEEAEAVWEQTNKHSNFIQVKT